MFLIEVFIAPDILLIANNSLNIFYIFSTMKTCLHVWELKYLNAKHKRGRGESGLVLLVCFSPICCIHCDVAIFVCCEQCINIYTFPFIISIKLNGCADRYLTDMAEAKRNDPILQKGGLGVEVIGSGSKLFVCCLLQCVMRISGQDYLLSFSTFLSPWRWKTERRDERQPECRPERGGSHPQRPVTGSMRLRSRGKYWQKFWELIGKFQDIITNKILGLTHRERNLLDKMQKENEEKQKSSISYIIVRKSVLFNFFNVCVLDCG